AEGLRRETNGQQGGQHDRADTQAPEGCGIHDVHAVSFSLAKLLFRCEMAVGRAEPADFDRTHSITHTAAPAAFASWPRRCFRYRNAACSARRRATMHGRRCRVSGHGDGLPGNVMVMRGLTTSVAPAPPARSRKTAWVTTARAGTASPRPRA